MIVRMVIIPMKKIVIRMARILFASQITSDVLMAQIASHQHGNGKSKVTLKKEDDSILFVFSIQ